MKKFEVLWTKSAEYDLESIIQYLKLDSVSIAKEIFIDIKKECENFMGYISMLKYAGFSVAMGNAMAMAK